MPSFLFTSRKWKLFAENHQRDRILTFPYVDCADERFLTASFLPLNDGFLKALTICLLSQKEPHDDSALGADQADSSLRRSLRLSERGNSDSLEDISSEKESVYSHTNSIPKFLCGFDEVTGLPQYQMIRVMSPDEVAEIELAITLKKHKTKNRKAILP